MSKQIVHYLAMSVALSGLCAISARAATLEYTAGHADIGVLYDAGALELHYHFGSNAMVNGALVGAGPNEFAPGEVFTRVADSRRTTVGAVPPGLGFTGLTPGGSIWVLTDPEVSGAPFLGIATEELTLGQWANITWSLGATSMPSGGNFSLWNVDGFGSLNPVFSTSNPNATSGNPKNSFTMNAGTHSHNNWGFTAAGVYEIELTVSGIHSVDGFKSDTASFLFAVGDLTAVPEPSSLLLLGAGVIGLCGGLRRRFQKPKVDQDTQSPC